MSATALAAGIAATGALATTAYNTWQQKKAEKRANDEYVKRLRMQQSYDSPVQQMQRLKQAGLNPNLAYQSLGNEQSGFSAPSLSSMPQADPAMIGSSMETMADVLLKKAQAHLTDAQAHRYEAENEAMDMYSDEHGNFYQSNAYNLLNIAKNQGSLLIAQTNLTNEQKKVAEAEMKKLDSETAINAFIDEINQLTRDAKILEIKSIAGKVNNEFKLSNIDVNYHEEITKQQIEQIKQNILTSKEDAKKLKSEAEYVAQNKKTIEYQINSLVQQGQLNMRQAQQVQKAVDWYDDLVKHNMNMDYWRNVNGSVLAGSQILSAVLGSGKLGTLLKAAGKIGFK